MEGFGVLVFLFLIFGGLGLVLRALHAFGGAALGKGSLADNLEATFKGMGPLQLRFKDERLGDKADGPLMKIIQVKGMFPVSYRRSLEFCTSVFDNTSGKYEAVAAALDVFQEQKTIAYQHKVQ